MIPICMSIRLFKPVKKEIFLKLRVPCCYENRTQECSFQSSFLPDEDMKLNVSLGLFCCLNLAFLGYQVSFN